MIHEQSNNAASFEQPCERGNLQDGNSDDEYDLYDLIAHV